MANVSLEKSIALSAFEKISVRVFGSPSAGSKEAEKEIADVIKSKNAEGKYAVLGLATGSTPKQVYKELIRLHKEEGLSFKKVKTFNLDEYYGVGADSKNSYMYFMRENLFNHIDIEPACCHLPDGTAAESEVRAHCEKYDAMIEEAGGIDFQLLGIGRNGHIGFNEPGSNINSRTRVLALNLVTKADAASEFGGISNVPRKAITMGVSTIMKAKRVALLAWSESKAKIIKQAVEGPQTEFVPASYLQGHHNAEVFLDHGSAAHLTRNRAPWLVGKVEWNDQLLKKAVTQLSVQIGKPILKLTGADYDDNGLSDLLAMYGNPYEMNIKVFNLLQHTITGWPGGKPNADDTNRPERAAPAKKRVLIFSPHPDDDIISMGGTFQRLADQGHEVHVAYQTSGNIAVADDEALRFLKFVAEFNAAMKIDEKKSKEIYKEAQGYSKEKKAGQQENELMLLTKGLIRKGEAYNTCYYVGLPDENVHYLNLPFYETGKVEKKPLSEADYKIVEEVISKVKPHQIYAAGDLADPHGTHKVCLDAVFEAVKRLKNEAFMKDCWLWLYKGAWAEWDIDLIEMAVPMSPDQVLKKRYGIFKHQSQKDGVMFQGTDNREFWQRAEDRNRQTAELYNKLGLADYEAMEAFVRWKY